MRPTTPKRKPVTIAPFKFRVRCLMGIYRASWRVGRGKCTASSSYESLSYYGHDWPTRDGDTFTVTVTANKAGKYVLRGRMVYVWRTTIGKGFCMLPDRFDGKRVDVKVSNRRARRR